MAKVDPTSLFTEIRGTVGGLTFSKNRSGYTVNLLKSGIPSKRPAPTAHRAAFRQSSIFWNLHRDDIYDHPVEGMIPVSEWWDLFADEPGNEKIDVFDAVYKPSGYNWFMTFALLQAQEGAPPLTLPPTDSVPGLWPSWTVKYQASTSVNNSYFLSTTTSAIQGTRPWVSARIQYRAADSPVVPPFFFISAFDYLTASTQHALQTPIESVFGSVPNNSRAFFSVRFRTPNGRISAPQRFSLLPATSYTYTAP